MTVTTFGDAARQSILSRNTTRLKGDIARLTQEMSTGLVSDPARHLQGQITTLARLEGAIIRAEAARPAAMQINVQLEGQYAALESVESLIMSASETALRPELLMTDDRLPPVAAQMGQALEHVVGLLNTQAGGRSLFAGVATDQAALAPARQMLTQIAALVPNGASPADIDQIVADWFGPGGGFEQGSYLGGPSVASSIELDNGLILAAAPTATDAPIRAVLAGLAKGALMENSMVALPPQSQRAVLMGLGDTLRSSAEGLRGVMEKTGQAQARTESALSRLQAAQVSAEIARTNLIGADPYESATALQDSIGRLEQIFALTARLSRMSLSNYL
jgi:flagellar hook-associated protein 3 FlgL